MSDDLEEDYREKIQPLVAKYARTLTRMQSLVRKHVSIHELQFIRTRIDDSIEMRLDWSKHLQEWGVPEEQADDYRGVRHGYVQVGRASFNPTANPERVLALLKKMHLRLDADYQKMSKAINGDRHLKSFVAPSETDLRLIEFSDEHFDRIELHDAMSRGP